MFVDVILIEGLSSQDQIFTYEAIYHSSIDELVGRRVLVPVGNKKVVGLILSEAKNYQSLTNIKQVYNLLDDFPLFNNEMLQLCIWTAEYYCCPIHRVLGVMLPPAVGFKKRLLVKLVETQNSKIEELTKLYVLDTLIVDVIKALALKALNLDSLRNRLPKKEADNIINSLIKKGVIRLEEELVQQNIKTEKFIKLIKHVDLPTKAMKQKEIIEFLKNTNAEIALKELLQAIKVSNATLKALEAKGIVSIFEKKIVRDPFYDLMDNEIPNNLTANQKKVISSVKESIDKESFQSYLLNGVTGSGKTEVYIRLAEYTMNLGKNVLVLVPEISLTPQLASRFRQRFGDKVALLHSGLTSGERYDEWHRIFSGQVKIVIGVRSAVFAPLKNLGLIILDEEHEASYKQSEPEPRYHAKKIALERGKLAKATVILGSATPSLESYLEMEKGEHQLLEMLTRVNERPLPPIEVVDMRHELTKGNFSVFSTLLQNGLKEVLAKNEQAILLLNRRGFATFVMCRECGFVVECNHCSIPMTYHSTGPRLYCHYCGEKAPVPKSCSHCGSHFIKYFGSGTQKVESALSELLPDARIIRMDVDTVRAKGSHWNILKEFQSQKANILVGTQMIAKGLDFPKVSLVGVISADITLNLPDYLAAERSYQLLTQVAGRAGRRDIAGKVIVQTYQPQHFVLDSIKMESYLDFYQEEINIRKSLDYPPFSKLVRIILSGLNDYKVKSLAEAIYKEVLQKNAKPMHILGPNPAPIERIKDRFRWHILLKGDVSNDLQLMVQKTKEYVINSNNKEVRVTFDIDPQNIL